jgi:hypothetical protein
MNRISENTIESFAIELLKKLGYEYIYSPDIMPSKTIFLALGGGLIGKWPGLQISSMPMAIHTVIADQPPIISVDGQVLYSKNQQITYLCNKKAMP